MKPIEQAKQVTAAALDKLRTSLDAGRSDELRVFLAAMAKFHKYSLSNVMLINAQRPDATRVAGYKTWQNLGRQVRKGEKGIVIFAPMRVGTDERDDDRSEEQDAMRFRAVRVFDIAQTDGAPLPNLTKVTGNPAGHQEKLKRFIAARSIDVTHVSSAALPGSLGASLGGSILIVEGLEPAEEFSVLVHELAHEMLHKDGDRATRVIRETEAEAVAFVVCEAIGLKPGTSSADYIQLYDGDAETLTTSLEQVRKTATRIIEAVVSADEQEACNHTSESARHAA